MVLYLTTALTTIFWLMSGNNQIWLDFPQMYFAVWTMLPQALWELLTGPPG